MVADGGCGLLSPKKYVVSNATGTNLETRVWLAYGPAAAANLRAAKNLRTQPATAKDNVETFHPRDSPSPLRVSPAIQYPSPHYTILSLASVNALVCLSAAATAAY